MNAHVKDARAQGAPRGHLRPPRPRWSNYRIGALPMRVRMPGPEGSPPWYSAQSVIDACRMIRDDYEDEYERLCQRIADLEVLLERERDKWRILAERNRELEKEVS